MVGLPYDCVMNPIGVVRSTFKEATSSGTDPAVFADRDWGAVDVFNQFLFHQNGLSQVPILDYKTAKWIKPNTLVRFRGMIQDMYANEHYIGAYKDGSVWRTNKFIDFAEVPLRESMSFRMWNRILFYCVPVPGLNSWAEPSSEATIKRSMDQASQQREKRLRSDDEAVDNMDLEVPGNGLEASPSAKKMREDRHPSESTLPQKPIFEDAASSGSVLPQISEDSLSCIVKIYDTPESEFKLNEVFEFIGVFTLDPQNQDAYDEFEDHFADEAVELDLPQLPHRIKVPHLHCFIHQKLAPDDFLQKPSMIESKPDNIKVIREALLRYLTDVLGGDRLAADFMLLHLLSKVHHRADTFAVGKFSLNLTGLSNESVHTFGTQLRLAIENLLPFTNYLPITIESLNSASFSPKKDHETNRLITGPLQVVEGTHLILDETKLEAGTLNSVGVDNARSLKSVFELQKVYYDYKYSQMVEMLADIQLLVLSEGKSNLCPADLILPFRPSSAGGSSVASADELDTWRWYLATLRSLPHTIELQLQNVIENDLARVRQLEWNLGAQGFSRLLTMGRLLCMSYGETSLSREHWQMVINLETQRRQRLN